MSDDFFSTVPPRTSTADVDHDDFAHAISLRFGSADLRTPRLLHGDSHPHTAPQPPPPPPPHPPLHPDTNQPFSSLPPSHISTYLDDPRTLILDIRPHAAHAAARINNAISLSVPTTLLKRPLFSLSKLSQMLPSPSSRARFVNWPSASRILVYDSDSVSSPDNSIIAGLLRKFRAEGFSGELAWIRGGFQAVWREARDLATTDLPPPEDDEPDPASSSGTLRTSHLPKAAFSLLSTTAVPPRLAPAPGPLPLPNTPAPRAANPFFDTIRQNVELSHGITERIPLRLPSRVRRRIHDLPFPWLQDIASRSALRRHSASRLGGLESGSESSDDPHTSDPDENHPNVEEGTEALAMQFYRIELAEQRRLRSIMEHHTRESELSALASPAKSRRTLEKRSPADPVQGGVSVRTGAKSVPGTPHIPPFPFSITAGVEKGTKNRYTHIWPFEHARVRLHDSRHQGSHPGKRDKGKALERGRSTRERAAEHGKEREEQRLEQDKYRRSRSSPAFGKSEDQDVPEVIGTSSKYVYSDPRSSISQNSMGFEAGLTHPILNPRPSVPQVKIEYDATVQDSRVSGPPTPATAPPLPTSFYTPMEISPGLTPMRAQPLQQISFPFGIGVSPGARFGGTQSALSASSLPSLGPLPSLPLRLPSCQEGLSPSTGEQARALESLSSSAAPAGGFLSTLGGEEAIDAGMKRDQRREPSPVDDYVNASYVQPLGTRKRYIATQGPLPSTYVDFWTLVWEQNVHVIVMLTREVESAMVKCGSYWTNTEYGPLKLELLSTSPPISPSANTPSKDVAKQGFFAIREPRGKIGSASRDQPTLITRMFALTHTSYPGVPPRRITHLQYLDWSDMNVPDDPRGVLDLVKKLEQAVADSTPGPSRSLSPGSTSGSLSGSQSPDVGPDRKGHDTSLLSPTRASFIPRGGRRRRGSEWRHPELDSKTGIASFALGNTAPVLLHCSAGVGRTGGFIAVDAVLDGIRRELRKNREERNLKKRSGVNVVVGTGGKADMSDVEASGEFSLESTEAGVNSVESGGKESASDESERMDVDEPAVDKAKKTQDSHHMINTVPIPVSAGDRTKSRRRHYHNKDSSGAELRSSSKPLVVHVPYVGADGAPETNVAGIDLGAPKVVGWQSSSTREWVEQVSDQTHVHAEEADRPCPPSSRERSPGGASNSSDPSAINSADDSVNGSVSATGGSASGSGSGNKVDRKSATGSASGSGTGSGSGSGRPPPSSSSKPGSGSISLSNSGSGTGTGSRLGSSLLRVRLRDSSVTSVSIESTDSQSARHEPKNASLHRPSMTHTSSSSDMEIDCPPRPVSAPLQPTHLNTMVRQRAVHSKPMLGLSPVASFSSPILPPGPVERGISTGDAAEGPASLPNSDAGSDVLASPPRESERGGSAEAEGSGKNGQPLTDEPEEPSVPSKSRSKLRFNTELTSLRIPGTLHSGRSAKSPPLPSRESKGKARAAIPLMPRVPDDSALQQFPPAPVVPGTLEHDQCNADHQVVDYKLPRELHSYLSPPMISSFAEPICTVIQDMREQRMSLCQSLRQYVFVHAAIIEGALKIVDEERELWGSSGTSDDASSAEGESMASVKEGGQQPGYGKGTKAWFGGTDKAEVAAKTPELELGNVPHRIRPLHIPASSSSGVTSPLKGKRGPSPTELLKEDKTGALSLNKRPSILRQTSHEGNQLVFESSRSSPAAGENGGGSREIVDTCATLPAPGRPAVPERGGLTGGDRANFE